MDKYKNIDDYIKQFPKDVQEILKKIRVIAREEAPDAEERIAYGMPTFTKNKNLFHFAAYKNHIGFYPTPAGIENFQKEIEPYKYSKGTIQFQLNEPIPYDLIRKIIKLRVIESNEVSK